MPPQDEGSEDTTRARRVQASSLAKRGLLSRAMRLLEAGLAESQSPLERAALHNSMSVLLLNHGYLNDALGHQRKALAGYRDVDSPRLKLALGNKAAILTRLRRYESALCFLDQAEQVDQQTGGDLAFRAALLANRAHALQAMGRADQAQVSLSHALDVVEHTTDSMQARILSTLTPVLADLDPRQAYQMGLRGLDRAERSENRAAQAYAHFALGQVAPSAEQRRSHLVQALRLCGSDHLLRSDVILAVEQGGSRDAGRDEHLNSALEAELEIREALRQGQRNTHLQKLMVQTLCHDLRNPLTAMVMSTHAVEVENPETVDELLELVRSQCAAIADLLGQLEDTALAMDGQLVTGLSRIDSAAVLAEALNRARPAALKKNTRLTLKGQEIWCTADRALVARVLDNLLSNAVKFSPPGGEVLLHSMRRAKDCVFQVRDQGPGLSTEDLKSIFEPFGKGSARPTAGEPSTGMGLFLAAELARAMGGSLGAHTDGGAVFELQLPMTDSVASLAGGSG